MQITIREATPNDVEAIATLHVTTWRETYQGLLPDAYLSALTPASREPLWQQILTRANRVRCVLVAAAPDQTLVGFASGGPHRGPLTAYPGELFTLYLLQAYQGQGLGKRLFMATTQCMQDQQHVPFALWVLATNQQARGFYEAIGGQEISERTIDFAGLSLHEVSYGWATAPAPDQASIT